MINIKLVRVDFRVIHGQVVTKWVKQAEADRIIVIDDKIVKNEMLKKVFKMTAPPNVSVDVYDTKAAAEMWKNDTLGIGDVLVIFKTIASALKAWKEGFPITNLQIGGAGGGPGQKQVYHNINLSPQEFDDLNVLHENGVKIILQAIPEEKPLSYSEVYKKIK